jgi:hypothetical protein
VASCGLYVSLICGKRRIMENRNQCYKFWLSKSDGIVWSSPGKCPTTHRIRILIFLPIWGARATATCLW